MSGPPLKTDSIFWAALDIQLPHERSAYLDRACAGDQRLRAQVAELLDAYPKAQGFLEQAAVTLDPPPLAEGPGTVIGRYKLLEEIGEGGMGVVYMAEQREPVRRKVALKVIKPGMDTRQVIGRFEAERQALAMMDHPNIAKVLDAGTTEESSRHTPCAVASAVAVDGTRSVPTTSGRPYFVMELVHGVPITAYCDANELTTRERLELFVTVCQAVQHAHQKGIIHRDLKPANVMVTVLDDAPVAKIIDFGIAKATHQQLTDKTVFTGYGQMLGTPQYMSPEQASLTAADVDTRSDIYSLGVLLYELLTGNTPFDQTRLREASYDEVRRMVREDEPPRPSARISTLGEPATTISAQRKTDPKRLSHELRRDLDWIVMKALAKDRTHRYQTAGDLARDIQRYLHCEPVEARPPTLGDRTAKWVRRHRAAVWSAIATLILTLICLAVSIVLIAGAYNREKQHRRTADQERVRAEERETALRHYLYAADLKLAHQAWKNAEVSKAREILSRHVPGPDESDLRGFEWHYLWGLCQQDQHTLRGHTGEVYCIAFSPDGRTLASASQDGTVRLWDVAAEELRRTLRAHAAEVCHVAFSPDGATLAATGDTGLVKLWDVATSEERAVLKGHTGDVFGVAFSPDGRLLATGGCDDTVKLWNVQTMQEAATLRGHTGDVQSLAFAPDGRTLASASSDETVKLWDVASRKVIATIDGHDKLSWVAYSPDGRTLATAGTERMVRLWQLANLSQSRGLPGHANWIHCVAFSPDSKVLASASRDGSVRIWGVATGGLLNVLRGHTGRVWCAAFSPDGRTLATSGGDRTIKLWDPSVRQDCRRGPAFSTGIAAVAFRPDDTLLISSGRQLVSWDPQRAPEAMTAKELSDFALRAVFSPDGRLLALGNDRGEIRLWNVSDGSPQARLGRPEDTRHVEQLAFSPDGRTLAAADSREVAVWDVWDRRERTAARFEKGSFSVAVAPHSRTLAAGSGDGIIRLSDAESGQEQRTMKGGQDESVFCLAFSPDGATLAAAGDDRVIRRWDTATGRLRQTLVGHSDWVQALAHTPDGKTLVSGSRDGTLRFWSPVSGRELLCLDAPIAIDRLAFSQDGRQLVGGGSEAGRGGEVYVWTAAGNRETAAAKPAAPVQDSALPRGRGKGDRSNLCEAPEGPYRRIGPVPFSTSAPLPVAERPDYTFHPVERAHGEERTGHSDSDPQ